MNTKNLRLGIVLFILILAAYIYKGPYESWRNNQRMPDNVFNEVDLDEIDKIEVSDISGTTELEKNGEKWIIEGPGDFYAKKTVMNQVLDSLRLAREAQIETVSTNVGNKGNFLANEPGADSGQGISVSLYKGEGKLLTFIVGKMAPDFVSTYFSIPDNNNTYSVKANLRTAFDQYDWRDDVIFADKTDAITRIRFQYPDREFAIEKTVDDEGKESWQGVSPRDFEVSTEKANKLAGIMTDLKSIKIPTQTFDGTGLEKNLIIVQASGDGVDNTIMVGDKNNEDLYYAKRGDSDNIYLIEKSIKEGLDATIEGLK